VSTLDLSREHAEEQPPGLPPLMIDRQRVVHSAAFRRLQQKTQVFVAPESDHFRTRMTHTLEVAQLARCLAYLANLNSDLAEVTALAHDLGHPPFGHAGEKALNACMRDHGGFEHNRHTLRIVEELEHPYPDFHGLNLTHATRECLAKHSTPYDQPGQHPLQDGQPPPPECVVVDLADRVTYALHDLQDGLYAELLDPRQLREVDLWRWAYAGPDAPPADAWRGHLRPAIDRIQQRVLQDVAAHGTVADAPIVALSPAMNEQLAQLDQFLYAHLYHSAPLQRADAQARDVLTSVFEACVANPDTLPPRFRRRIETLGVYRVVADYVAGMTDRYCQQEHARLSDAPAGA
jgi:dGTPase